MERRPLVLQSILFQLGVPLVSDGSSAPPAAAPIEGGTEMGTMAGAMGIKRIQGIRDGNPKGEGLKLGTS